MRKKNGGIYLFIRMMDTRSITKRLSFVSTFAFRCCSLILARSSGLGFTSSGFRLFQIVLLGAAFLAAKSKFLVFLLAFQLAFARPKANSQLQSNLKFFKVF